MIGPPRRPFETAYWWTTPPNCTVTEVPHVHAPTAQGSNTRCVHHVASPFSPAPPHGVERCQHGGARGRLFPGGPCVRPGWQPLRDRHPVRSDVPHRPPRRVGPGG